MEITVDQALERGIAAHKAGNAHEADQYYTAVLQVNPKHPDANHNMGVLAVGLGKTEAALPFFQAALEINANIVQFWLSYIDALIKLERVDEAKNVIKKAKKYGLEEQHLKKREKNLRTVNRDQADSNGIRLPNDQLKSLVDAYNRGQIKHVFLEATELSKKYPKNIVLWNLMGAAAAQLGQPDQAISAFKKALSIEPNNAEVYNNLGNVYKGESELQEAIKFYKIALTIKPNYAEAYNNLGAALKEDNRYDEALEAFNHAISINPNIAEAHFNIGNVLKDQVKLEAAIEAYKKSLLIKANYAEAYQNIGGAYRDMGNLEEAMNAFKSAVLIKPNYAEAYNSLGDILDISGVLPGAIDAFKKAISIDPEYAHAYNNLGNVFLKLGKLDSAIEAYRESLRCNDNHTEALNNLGVALQNQGQLEDAVSCYTKLLSDDKKNSAYWNNIYFPLQALKAQEDFKVELHIPRVDESSSHYPRISESILRYRLHRNTEKEGYYVNQSMEILANAENARILNPKFKNNSTEPTHQVPNKMVALLHFGRSGTGLLHSLIDGHSQVSTLPGIYFSEYFDYSTWMKIISKGWDGMVDRFMSIYDVLFDATSPVPVATRSAKMLYNIGITEGMTNVGDQRNEILYLDREIFRSELNHLLTFYEQIDALTFFKLVHVAFNKTLSDESQKTLIFYHIHNPDYYAMLNFSKFNPKAKWIIMIREPIQSCESWIKEAFDAQQYDDVVRRIVLMLFEVSNPVFTYNNARGLRLEDLKEHPHKTIQALCDWMGIEEADSLYRMTAQGKKWWGDPSSQDYAQDGMRPFGKTSINREVGSIFSGKDQFILQTLFYPFSVRFGYTAENETKFKADLKTVQPLLEEMFDFEKSLAAKTDVTSDNFMKSGSYLYFRSCLKERWETLNKMSTYPNMISPLKI